MGIELAQHGLPPQSAYDLKDGVVVAIGLMRMGTDTAEMARLMEIPDKRFGRFCRLLNDILDSTDPVVRYALNNGFPPGLTRPIQLAGHEGAVKCPTCGARIRSVPCQVCSIEAGIPEAPSCEKSLEYPPPYPARPTSSPPGTWQKLRVMQSRAARGEAIFHPKDVCDFRRVGDVKSVTPGKARKP